VSRSTTTITPPQAGHGGKDTRDVSSTEAAGTGGGFVPSAHRQRVRQGEDDVGVPNREQLALALGEPGITRAGQTFRAMPVAT
jgi:hypothetical protein